MIDLDELEKRTESGCGGYVVLTHQLLDLLELARIGKAVVDESDRGNLPNNIEYLVDVYQAKGDDK